MKELIKEKRMEIDQMETDKIFNAIHKQAYWIRKDRENKKIMDILEKEERKTNSKKDKIKEVLKQELWTALLLVASAPCIVAWMLLSYCLTH